MFVNRMAVQVTIKCGECPRTGVVTTQLSPRGAGEDLVLRSDNMQPPADWKQVRIGDARTELFCPICAREVR